MHENWGPFYKPQLRSQADCTGGSTGGGAASNEDGTGSINLLDEVGDYDDVANEAVGGEYESQLGDDYGDWVRECADEEYLENL